MADEKIEEAAAPEVAFATKDEFTEFISKRVGEAIAPKKRKLEEMQAQIDTLTETAGRVAELEAQLSGKEQTAAQKWDNERATLEQRQKALQAQIEESNANTQATLDRWHGAHRRQFITERALEAGAAPSAVADVAALFPGDRVRVDESNGSLSAVMVDPDTGLDQDAGEAMAAWLETKPHLCAAKPGGSGSPGASAGQKKSTDPLDGKSGPEQLAQAFGMGK